MRARLDWKYLLGLSLDDPGFDHTVLAEFRGKVAEAGLEQVALDALLAKLAADGLVKAGGKQRADSTHVVAAVAALNRLELAGESVRAAVEALAAARPNWLAQRICVPDWTRRYGTPLTSWRPRGVSKNHAMNTAKVSTLLDVLLSHRGPPAGLAGALCAGNLNCGDVVS